MNKEIPKTDRVTFITEKNNWLDAGGVKELKMNKSKDVVQIHFENGNIAEIHSCNPYGEGRGALVVSDLVSLANVKVDSLAESGLSPTPCSASSDDSTGLDGSVDPLQLMQDLFSSPSMDKYLKLSVCEFLHLLGETFHKVDTHKSKY